MSNNRKSERIRTLLAGRIVYNNGLSWVECYVRDLSDNGAKLTVDIESLMPDEFELEIPRKNFRASSRTKWRMAQSVGVEFVQDEKSALNADQIRHIAVLEAEVAMLRRRVAEMAARLDGYGDSARWAV